MIDKASSLAALGLQNLPLLSILGSNVCLEEEQDDESECSVDFSSINSPATATAMAEVRRREVGGKRVV